MGLMMAVSCVRHWLPTAETQLALFNGNLERKDSSGFM